MISLRVLVADDNVDLCENVAELLADLGHDVDQAPGGEEALLAVASKRYDLLILDLRMPRATGLDVLERARAIDPRVRAVFLTAYSGDTLLERAERASAGRVILKPPGPGQIDAVLSEIAAEIR